MSIPTQPGATRLPATEALRIAAQLTDTEEDLHAIARVVLALVGADDDLTGAAAERALAQAGVPEDARRLLMSALGPPPGRPSVAELRAGLERASASTPEPPRRTGIAGLFDELRGRRVTHTALWYVGASVAIVEAANVFVPMLGGPIEIVRLLAIVAAFGLPIALTLSWTFDVSTAARASSARWPRLALLGAVTIVSLAAAIGIWRSGATPLAPTAAPTAAADPAHIAVADFNAVGGDAELQAFAHQLQLRLIDGLSRASIVPTPRERKMRVLSYAGVLPFMRSGAIVDSLREARQVGTVLDGTVEKTQDAMRVFVRLVDTSTGDQISTSVATIAADRLALLDAVADSVIVLVRRKLGPVVRDHMLLLETRNPAAFDQLAWASQRLEEFEPAFRRADYATARNVLSDADTMLAEAERLDREWIEPIVLRGRQARRHVQLAFVQRDDSAVVRALQQGIAHAERALAIKAGDPRALELRGELLQHWIQTARPGEAERERLRNAAERDLRASLIGHPAPAGPLRMLSELAASSGRMQEAQSYGTRAYEQDPFMEQVEITVFRLFEYSLALLQDEAAARWCTEGRQRYGDWAMFQDCRLSLGAWSDAHPLTVDSAWSLVDAELRSYPAPHRPVLEPRLHVLVAAVLARSNQPDSARALLQRARLRDSSSGVLRAAAGVYHRLNETDSVLSALRVLLADPRADRRGLRDAIELRHLIHDARVQALFDSTAGAAR